MGGTDLEGRRKIADSIPACIGMILDLNLLKSSAELVALVVVMSCHIGAHGADGTGRPSPLEQPPGYRITQRWYALAAVMGV